jgi:N,N'-diacetylbacillosaminyl-diphospho-undecaprenol alpha-1,3-N-acetylgalactosaminyltransferase
MRSLKNLPGAEVTVIGAEITNGRDNRKEVEDLEVKLIDLEMYRFINPFKDSVYCLKLYRIFRQEKFDVIINFTTKPNILGPIVAKIAGAKIIIDHVVGLGTTFSSNNINKLKSKLLQLVLMSLYRISCNYCDKVWFTNPNDPEIFRLKGIFLDNKTVITNNYLDTAEYYAGNISKDQLTALRQELGLFAHDKVVVMVARMIWSKGVREFAEAAQQLKDAYPRWHFLLVAPLEPSNFDAVPEAYIREMEKKANLQWLGFREDVKAIYALADMAVLPTYYKEGGYPRALLEPMSMGKPIITTNSDDCRGTVEEGKNGYLVPIKDSRALSLAISQLIENEALRLQFGQYSREKAQREFDEKSIIIQALTELGLRSLNQTPGQ